MVAFIVGMIKGSLKTLRIYGRGKSAVGLCIVLAAYLFVQISQPAQEYESPYATLKETTKTYEDGKEAFDAGQYDLADELLSQVPSSDPNYYDAKKMINQIQDIYLNNHLQNARAKLQQKDFDGAREELNHALEIDKYSKQAQELIVQLEEQENLAREHSIQMGIAQALERAKEKLSSDNFAGARADAQRAAKLNPQSEEVKQLENEIDVKEKNYKKRKSEQEMKRYKTESKTYSYVYLMQNMDSLKEKKVKLTGRLTSIGNTHSETFALMNLMGEEGKLTSNLVQIEYPMEYQFEKNDTVIVWGELQGKRIYKEGSEEVPVIKGKYLEKGL